MLVLIIVLLLVFGTGSGVYYGQEDRWGPRGGYGIGIGTILLILLVFYLLSPGSFPRLPR